MSEEKKQVTESMVRRALEVQEIYLIHKGKHLSNIAIFRYHIKPIYHISERTFYRYLDINARRLIKQFDHEE